MMYPNEMIQAAQAPTLKSLSLKEQGQAVMLLLHKVYELKGVEPLESDLKRYAEEIIAEVGNRYRAMTTAEVAMAFKYGVQENFGKDTRLCGSNLLMWLERYMTSPERTAAVGGAAKARAAEESRLLESAPEERERRHREFLQTAPKKEWENFKAAGGKLTIKVDGYAASVYDALVEMGKANATDETKARAAEMAKEQLRAEEMQKRGLIGSTIPVTFGGNEVYRTKRILLDAYFRNLYRRGVELNA